MRETKEYREGYLDGYSADKEATKQEMKTLTSANRQLKADLAVAERALGLACEDMTDYGCPLNDNEECKQCPETSTQEKQCWQEHFTKQATKENGGKG